MFGIDPLLMVKGWHFCVVCQQRPWAVHGDMGFWRSEARGWRGWKAAEQSQGLTNWELIPIHFLNLSKDVESVVMTLLAWVHSVFHWDFVDVLYFIWLVLWNINFIFHHIWDVIPTPLTNSMIFQDGHIAPPTSRCSKRWDSLEEKTKQMKVPFLGQFSMRSLGF